MRPRIGLFCIVLLLVALTLALTGLAYASPPDPTWTRGMYDDADFDDVVGYITSASGLVEVIAVPDLRPGDVLIIPPLPPSGPAVSLDPPSAQHPRAPPLV
jgi:hypothetical protein